jgi:hypothetical protein
VVGGYRGRDTSESQLIETHFTGSPQGQDGVAFFDNSSGNFLRCTFTGNTRSCIGLAGDVSVFVDESEFVGNPTATIIHADYPHLPPAEEVGYSPQPVVVPGQTSPSAGILDQTPDTAGDAVQDTHHVQCAVRCAVHAVRIIRYL